MQLVGFDERVMKELLKHMSVNLCPNTLGQVRPRDCCSPLCSTTVQTKNEV